IEVLWTKRIGYSETGALLLEHPAIILAPACPHDSRRIVFAAQQATGFVERDAPGSHLRRDRREIGAERADAGTLRPDKDAARLARFAGSRIENAQANLDNLAEFARRWVAAPAGRFHIHHQQLLRVRHLSTFAASCHRSLASVAACRPPTSKVKRPSGYRTGA